MGSVTLCNFGTSHTYGRTCDIAGSVFRPHFNLSRAVNTKDEKVYFFIVADKSDLGFS